MVECDGCMCHQHAVAYADLQAEVERLLVLLDHALYVIPDGYPLLRDDIREALDLDAAPSTKGGGA